MSDVRLNGGWRTYEEVVPARQRKLAKQLGYDYALLYVGRVCRQDDDRGVVWVDERVEGRA